MNIDLIKVLDSAAEVAAGVASLPFPVGAVAKIIEISLKAASAIAKASKDPVIEIERILSADPLVKQVHADWAKLIEEKFHAKSVPPPPPEPNSPVDIYEGGEDEVL
jgi:hypothetical protein